MIEAILDRLTFDEHVAMWACRFETLLFGRIWTVVLEMDGGRGSPPSPPKSSQISTLSRFIGSQRDLEMVVEVALFDYYEKLRLELGPERFPEVWNPDGLAKVLVPKTIYLPDPGPTARRILIILLDCSWDEQLGVGIRLIDEAVDTVGEQTLVL